MLIPDIVYFTPLPPTAMQVFSAVYSSSNGVTEHVVSLSLYDLDIAIAQFGLEKLKI